MTMRIRATGKQKPLGDMSAATVLADPTDMEVRAACQVVSARVHALRDVVRDLKAVLAHNRDKRSQVRA